MFFFGNKLKRSLLDKKTSPLLLICISLILSGAIGNVIDSVFYGIIYNNAKKPDNAIEYLNKGLEYNGTLPESLLSLGNSFYLKKNYEKAIQLYDQSLDKGLNDISAVYFNKGLVYERMSNVDLAIKFYKKAVGRIKFEFSLLIACLLYTSDAADE